MMVINNVKVAIVVHCDKGQLFWEGHKNLHNPPRGFDVYLLVNVKTMRTIAQNLVAFSEKLNFTEIRN